MVVSEEVYRLPEPQYKDSNYENETRKVVIKLRLLSNISE